MKNLLALIFTLFAISAVAQTYPPPKYYNRFTTTPDNVPVNGNTLTNISSTSIAGVVTNSSGANTFFGVTGITDSDDRNDIIGTYNELANDGWQSNIVTLQVFGKRFDISGTTNMTSLFGPGFAFTGPIIQNQNGLIMSGVTTGLCLLPSMTNYTVIYVYKMPATNLTTAALDGSYNLIGDLKDTNTASIDAMVESWNLGRSINQQNNGTAFNVSPEQQIDINNIWSGGTSLPIGQSVTVAYERSNGVDFAWQNTHPSYFNSQVSSNSIITNAINELYVGNDPSLSGTQIKYGGLELQGVMVLNIGASQSVIQQAYTALAWTTFKGHSLRAYYGDSRLALGIVSQDSGGYFVPTDFLSGYYQQNPSEKFINYSRGGTAATQMTNNVFNGSQWMFPELTLLPQSKFTSIEVDTDFGVNDNYLNGTSLGTIETTITNGFALPKTLRYDIGFFGIYDVGTNNSVFNAPQYSLTYSNNFVLENIWADTNQFFTVYHPADAYITQLELQSNSVDHVHFGYTGNPDQTIPTRLETLVNGKGKPWFNPFTLQDSLENLYPAPNTFTGNGGGLTNLPFVKTVSISGGSVSFSENTDGSSNASFTISGGGGGGNVYSNTYTIFSQVDSTNAAVTNHFSGTIAANYLDISNSILAASAIFSGTVQANLFSGGGSGLTGVPAASLTGSATLPASVLPTSVPTSVTYNANGTTGGGASISANVLTVTAPTPSGGGSAFVNGTNIFSLPNASGYNDLYIGTNAGNVGITSGAQNNTAVGVQSQQGMTVFNNDTSVGYQTLFTGAGSSDTIMGAFACPNGGNGMTCIGVDADEFGTSSASSDSCVGEGSMGAVTGSANWAGGAAGLQSINSGNSNSVDGYTAGGDITTANGNTADGAGALGSVVTGGFNIGIGFNGGANLIAGNSNNIEIGNAGVAGDTNQIRIGNVQTNCTFPINCIIHGNGSGLTNIFNLVASAATSGTVTAAVGVEESDTYLSSGSTITSLTFAMPSTATTIGQKFFLHSISAVTTLTVTGGSFLDTVPVTAMTAGQTIGYQATSTGGAYIRIQ